LTLLTYLHKLINNVIIVWSCWCCRKRSWYSSALLSSFSCSEAHC